MTCPLVIVNTKISVKIFQIPIMDENVWMNRKYTLSQTPVTFELERKM